MQKTLMLLIAMALILSGCTESTPPSPYEGMKLQWKVISNLEKEDPESHAALIFKNEGQTTINHEGWDLYFSHGPRPVRATEGAGEITHVSSDFYRFTPNTDFQLAPGEELRVDYYMAAWLIKEVDGPRGVYVRYMQDGKEAFEKVEVDKKNFWEDITTIRRHKGDSATYPTPEALYARNAGFNFSEKMTASSGSGFKELGEAIAVEYAPGLENEADYLKTLLGEFSSAKVSTHQAPHEGAVFSLMLSPQVQEGEGYELAIADGKAQIKGRTTRGVFYGIPQLIRRLQRGSIASANETFSEAPRFPYRGLHLDVARNFQEIKSVKKIIDLMAFYRVNTLQFHLTEDEGWRLEIPGLPELTEVGSKRQHALKDDNKVHPAYGSGPEAELYGSGYYTRDEYIDLLKYAKSRHVAIIPEINFPGHARAAIKSMNARYERLKAEGKMEEAEQYWLIDPQDTSKYLSAQLYTDNVTCVCKESVYDFYAKVMDEVVSMYKEAEAPLKIIHSGGDEVPRGSWEGSPICQEFLKKHPELTSFKDLEKHFHRRLATMFAEKGYQLAAWEEIAMNADGSVNPEFVKDNALCYVWNNLWGAADLGNRLANAGYPVILCNVTNLYFDLAYNGDPEEPGLYWGGYVDTRDAFNMMPYNVFAGTPVNNMDVPNSAADFAGMEKLTPAGRRNVLGVQAELWSETIEGADMLEYYVLPKMIGFAEMAWDKGLEADEESGNPMGERTKKWSELAQRIGTEDLPMLDILSDGFNYRIPPAGASIKDGTLYANVEFPGLTLMYKDGEGEPMVYEGPVKVKGPISVWAQTSTGRRGKVHTLEASMLSNMSR